MQQDIGSSGKTPFFCRTNSLFRVGSPAIRKLRALELVLVNAPGSRCVWLVGYPEVSGHYFRVAGNATRI